MTRIRCRERRCRFNKNGICTSEEIEYEPDAGCLTMELRQDLTDEEEEWEEEEDADEDLEEELEDEEDEEEEEDKWDEGDRDEEAYLGGHPRKR